MMEFHEKLQQLRKQNNLTQEQLAEQLFVSRTAVSKWESGRGYPNLESLKCISKLFSISIDELLSNDELIELAETENRSNINKSPSPPAPNPSQHQSFPIVKSSHEVARVLEFQL